MLKIEQLNQFYGQSHTLWDLDLEVPDGQCTVLMGRNGVGKTTLLKCIMGLLPVRSGSLQYDGQELTRTAAEQRAGIGIGYVPQGRQIFPLMSVEENLLIGLPARRDGQRRIPAFIFEMFPVLKEMLGRRGGDLSGGQQQQLAIGRALVTDPAIIMADEPTGNLDSKSSVEIMGIFQHLNEERGITVIFVTHEPDIAEHTRRVIRLADGQIVEDRSIAHPRRVGVTEATPVGSSAAHPSLVTQGAA